MKESAIREQMVATGESLFNRGLTAGSSGNLSVRLDDGWLITPTNVSLGRLDPARISKIDHNANLLAGDPPSKEAFLHLAMYEQRPADNCIVHLHSTYSAAVSCMAGLPADDCLPPLTAYFVMKVNRLPLIPYYRPGDLEACGRSSRDSLGKPWPSCIRGLP
jgi:ribulose-5-phosphate 4-epimerase/fuculose-1-phosphate aldolase